MGNCQAIDNASLVIQHPNGRAERMYWPVTANDIMKLNPGHRVALLLTATVAATAAAIYAPSVSSTGEPSPATVRITRIKLLRPADTLALGHAYRLLTAQEVMRVLRAKKRGHMKKKESYETKEKGGVDMEATRSELDVTKQGKENEKRQPIAPAPAPAPGHPASMKSRSWHPSLKSISEGEGGS